jgi:hypothetical protein
MVVKTFESRCNLVVEYLEFIELANLSWDDETAFPHNNPPSFAAVAAT